MWFAMYWKATSKGESTPHILVVRLGAMGDVIHTLPAVADLRSALPSARIAWMIDTRWQHLLNGNRTVDEVIPFPLATWRRAGIGISGVAQAWSFVSRVQSTAIDIAADFQGLIKSAAVARLSGAECVIGFDATILREPLAGLLYDRRSGMSCRHVVDRNRALSAQIAGVMPSGYPTFPLPPGELCNGLPERYVLASPQAGWGSKQWPAGHFSKLADMIWHGFGIPLVADCAPGQEHHAEQIRNAAATGAVLVHVSTIPQLIGATRAALAVVGVDSGPLHLAAALDKPGVAIFGPTDPSRNGPYGSSIHVIRDHDAATSYKRGNVPSRSMQGCTPAMVFDRIGPLLGVE